MPHPWGFTGGDAMPMGSGDFADVKLCFSGLIDQNWAAFGVGLARVRNAADLEAADLEVTRTRFPYFTSEELASAALVSSA